MSVDSPERQEALRLVADRLDLPRETLAGLAPVRPRGTGGAAPPATPRLLEAGLQRERDLLAAVVRNPLLLEELAALTPEHFDDPLHRRFREVLVARAAEDDELVALRAELGARADRDEIDERTGKELMLRLHERVRPAIRKSGGIGHGQAGLLVALWLSHEGDCPHKLVAQP